MSSGSTAPRTALDKNTRQGKLAQAYKYMIKRIMEAVEARYGKPADPVVREAVMVEGQMFFAKARELLNLETGGFEQFFYRVEELCQLLQDSTGRPTS